MKKSATLLALLAAMLCTFSCMKETDFGTGPAPEGYYEEIITTVIPGGGTRTSFDNTTGVFSWSDGDEIAFHLSNGEYIVAPIDPETSKVRLYIPEGVTRDEFAVYPASTIVTDHAEKGDMQLTLPDPYDISGALQSEYCPTTMLAVQDPESSTLRFNHAGGLVQLNLEVPAQTKTVKVEFPDRVVTGTIPVSADNTYYKLDLDDPEHNEEGGSEIDIKVSQEGLEEDTAVRINVPVPSGTYDKVKITYNDGEEDTLEYTKNSSFTLGRSGGKRISPDEEEFVDATNYLHFEGLEDGCQVYFERWEYGNELSDVSLYYSIDGKRTWNAYTIGTTDAIITLNEGDVVWFYNESPHLSHVTPSYWDEINEQMVYQEWTQMSDINSYWYNTLGTNKDPNPQIDYFSLTNGYDNHFNAMTDARYVVFCHGQVKVGGRLDALLSKGQGTPASFEFTDLFHGSISDASELILPDKPFETLTVAPYLKLFAGCNYLEYAPEVLPLTDLTNAPGIYAAMFANCYNLKTTPRLPATTLSSGCYHMMFYYSGISEAPELPATVLANGCYSNMFYQTGLTEAPVLPATQLAPYCYSYMFANCHILESAHDLPAQVAPYGCYQYMYYGCTTGLKTAPEIAATSWGPKCFAGMFRNCFSLEEAPSELHCEEFIQSQYIDLEDEYDGGNYLSGMFGNDGYASYVCNNVLTKSPRITIEQMPPTTRYFMDGMFSNCTALNEIYIDCPFDLTDENAQDIAYNWVKNVASTGTFYRRNHGVSWAQGNNAVPTGWSVYIIEDVESQI